MNGKLVNAQPTSDTYPTNIIIHKSLSSFEYLITKLILFNFLTRGRKHFHFIIFNTRIR